MRTENDFLGAKEVPVNAYYGIHTVRAMENFRVSRQLVHPELIRAMATVKQAAVEMNMSLGLLDARLGSAFFRRPPKSPTATWPTNFRSMPCKAAPALPPT